MPIFVYEGEFDARRWIEILERNQVTCLYTTPTLLRLLRNEIGDISPKRDFALRRVYSVGEPLNPEVLAWAERTFNAHVYDNYWQTETGSFVIANRPNLKVKRGAMGKAVEGVQVSIIDSHGREVINGEVGDIAVRPTLTSLFKGYWNFPEATRACFRAGWYITRDRGRRDKDGYFWFMARNDDVITCQAQRIGPFEVENALVSHPAIAESAAVGVTDAVTTEHVKAFVVLRRGFEASPRLAEEIAAHVRAQLSPLAMPREIEFCRDLPKTRSGKIRRDQLRRRDNFDKEKVFLIE
jgi:acetyl-CoA synthetase